jgi:hypothetical protein
MLQNWIKFKVRMTPQSCLSKALVVFDPSLILGWAMMTLLCRHLPTCLCFPEKYMRTRQLQHMQEARLAFASRCVEQLMKPHGLYRHAPLVLLIPGQTAVATSYDSTGASWLLLFLGKGKVPTQLCAVCHCGLQGHRHHAHV